jgi:cytochrome c-type biogenesis protein CcmH
MVLWIGFAILAAAVVWAVTRPLLAARASTPGAPDSELAVYKDQLAEIESERAQGLLAGSEAESARVEVARRLIRRAEERERTPSADAGAGSGLRNAVLWSAAALPLAALLIYLGVGSPSMPGRPYAARLNEPIEQASAADLVAKVEAHLRQNPNDGRGWDVLAPVYMRMGDFRQAADAFERATQLLGESPQRLAGFARASIMLANGVVEEPARKAYVKLRALDPKAVEPQVWLAIAKEQDGDLAGAAADYKALIAIAKEPWHSLLEDRMKSVAARLGKVPEAAAPEAEAKNAGEAPAGEAPERPNFHTMTPEQRQAFIEKMVASLAERLKTNGKDLEGWMQLVRSYVVLGRSQDATAALAEARSNFAGDEKALAQLQALAQVLGIGT